MIDLVHTFSGDNGSFRGKIQASIDFDGITGERNFQEALEQPLTAISKTKDCGQRADALR